MLSYLLKGFICLSFFLLFWICCFASNVQAEKVSDLKTPENGVWIVDKTNTLSNQQFVQLDRVCQRVHEKSGASMHVVLINTTEALSIEAFSTQLFNQWELGSFEENDGILFLIALKDRKFRIEIGEGLTTDRNEVSLNQTIDKEISPRFRNQEFSEGIYSGLILTSIDVLGFDPRTNESPNIANGKSPKSSNSSNLDSRTDRPTQNTKNTTNPGLAKIKQALPVIGLLGLGGLAIAGLVGGGYYLRNRPRKCRNCQIDMVRLSEIEDDSQLTAPEQLEESLGSVNYDVWACLLCDEVEKVRYGRFFTRYSKCPKCSYKTVLKIRRTLRQATTASRGLVHVQESCEYCNYHHEYTFQTARLSKRNVVNIGSMGGIGSRSNSRRSSSSSSRSSSGRSTSRRRRGGRSSGGGATGSW